MVSNPKVDHIEIYASYDAGKWAVRGYSVISEPFNTPQEALEYILKKRPKDGKVQRM